MYNYGWFALLYDRNQHKVVKIKKQKQAKRSHLGKEMFIERKDSFIPNPDLLDFRNVKPMDLGNGTPLWSQWLEKLCHRETHTREKGLLKKCLQFGSSPKVFETLVFQTWVAEERCQIWECEPRYHTWAQSGQGQMWNHWMGPSQGRDSVGL